MKYFWPCFATTYTLIFLGIPILEEPADPPQTTFYTNTVQNVIIPSDVSKILLNCKSDGTGNIYIDDAVIITFSENSSNSYAYTYDYSNGCSSNITSTSPIDVTSDLSQFASKVITIGTAYGDKCGGVQSSSGYFLVFE